MRRECWVWWEAMYFRERLFNKDNIKRGSLACLLCCPPPSHAPCCPPPFSHPACNPSTHNTCTLTTNHKPTNKHTPHTGLLSEVEAKAAQPEYAQLLNDCRNVYCSIRQQVGSGGGVLCVRQQRRLSVKPTLQPAEASSLCCQVSLPVG